MAVSADTLEASISEARDWAKWFRGEPHIIVNVNDDRFAELLDDLADALQAQQADAVRMREAAAKLLAECRAEFMVDGMWSDDGQLVKWTTVRRVEAALNPSAEGR